MTERILAAVLLASTPAVAAAQQPRVEAIVVVSGEGLVRAVPDRAWVSITTESRASSPRDAQRRNAEMMDAVQMKLRGASIPADAIRTTGYDLQQEWDFVNNRRVSRGYVARNTIEVRVDMIDRVGDVLELAVASGATSVGGVRFDLKDSAGREREALRLAVTDARAKAESAASAAGRMIDRVIRVEEQGVTSRPPMPFVAAAREVAAADAPPIAPGQMEFRSQVTISVELK